MNAPIQIRILTRQDLVFADSVRALAGWNQTRHDWEDFLALSPAGCFLAEWGGVPAGTATTIRFDDQVAWIGMLLVHPGYRQRGIGRALLRRCIDYLKGDGACCIKLDATPQGQILYEKLGFESQWSLTRWQTSNLSHSLAAAEEGIRGCVASDLEAVTALDRLAFGTGRAGLLGCLLKRVDRALIYEADGRIEGYGMVRSGARAKYLGPVVAHSNDAGTRLVRCLLWGLKGGLVFWDIPDANTAAVALARECGFTPQRPLLRMALGAEKSRGNPEQYVGIVDPAFG